MKTKPLLHRTIRPLDGKLDDLRIYNRALAPIEIETLAGIVPMEPKTPTHALAFSTYLGGSNWEPARDVCADAAGNVIVVGGTASANFPTTAGAYNRTFNAGVSRVPSRAAATPSPRAAAIVSLPSSANWPIAMAMAARRRGRPASAGGWVRGHPLRPPPS